MKTEDAKRIILETLDRANRMLASDANALTLTESGSVSPEKAYIEFVSKILTLA